MTGAGTAVTRVPLTVGQLTQVVKGSLARTPDLEDVLVEGEISNLRSPGTGHLYFTLKDRTAQLRCVCFRSSAARIPFQPAAGMTVVARGHVDVYEADGSYQLYVQSLDPSGIGAIALAVEQRRRRLAAEGLFDPARRRPLPMLPRRVAVVTSSTGAAVRDVLTVARRRNPGVGLVVVPTPVQGDGAEVSVVRALATAGRLRDVDVVLLVRGGGSIEDLVAFQSEAVVRAIAALPVPVVTGIGHETDTTLADLAADARGATPSNAAEIAVPEAARLHGDIRSRHDRLRASVEAALGSRRQRLVADARRLAMVSPDRRLPALRQGLDGTLTRLRSALLEAGHRRRRALDSAASRLRLAAPGQRVPAEREGLRRRRGQLEAATAATLHARRARLATAAGRLDALSPLRVLERGYSITLDEAGSVARATGLRPGDRLRTRLADGEVGSRVE